MASVLVEKNGTCAIFVQDWQSSGSRMISQSLVDEGYLRICQEWTVSSKAAAPPPAAPASSSLSPASRSFCAGSQLQRPQKLRVTALIGCGQVSLLSVALLASKGWTFTCSPGKSGSRTSREVDKPAKPPCLSLSHLGGHDQV